MTTVTEEIKKITEAMSELKTVIDAKLTELTDQLTSTVQAHVDNLSDEAKNALEAVVADMVAFTDHVKGLNTLSSPVAATTVGPLANAEGVATAAANAEIR